MYIEWAEVYDTDTVPRLAHGAMQTGKPLCSATPYAFKSAETHRSQTRILI